MGQQFHTQPIARKISDFENSDKAESPQKNIKLLSQSDLEEKKSKDSLQSHSQSLQSFELGQMTVQQNKQYLQRVEKLIQFIGQIIYYCKLYMKKQHKYHYKISALLFYKYFYDKFRQLLSKYHTLLQRKQISREQYNKKVNLVYQIKDTFIKIKKFIYTKIPFMNENTKSYLNEDSQQYCFSKKQFFTQLLYPEVKQIMQFYQQATQGQYDEAGISICYLRMIKAIFIIQELQFHKSIVEIKDKNQLPDYQIQKVQTNSQEEIKAQLIENYKLFLKIKRS